MKNYATTYSITGIESLQTLRTKRRKRYNKFIIAIENIDETKARKFENDLNKFHASCGCNTGNYFLSTSMVLCAIYFLVNGFPAVNWKLIAEILSALAAVALIGKIVGKILDGRKFNKTVEKLYQELLNYS